MADDDERGLTLGEFCYVQIMRRCLLEILLLLLLLLMLLMLSEGHKRLLLLLTRICSSTSDSGLLTPSHSATHQEHELCWCFVPSLRPQLLNPFPVLLGDAM